MNISIRSKLLISFSFILLLASMLIGLVFYLDDQYIRTQQITIMDEKVQAATDQIVDYFLSIRAEQQSLSNNIDQLNISDIELFATSATELMSKSPAIVQVTLLSPTGREFAKLNQSGRTPAEQLGISLPSTDFSEALQAKTVVSKAFYDDGSLSPHITIMTPTLNSAGRVTAVVKSEIELSILPEVLSSMNLGESGIAYIVDTEGQIIAHPQRELIAHQDIADRTIVRKLLDSGFASLAPADHYYVNENQKEVIASSNIIPDLGWVLVVEQPTSVVFSQLAFTRTLLMGSFAASIGLMVLLVIIISNGIAKPIKQLTSGARRIQFGDLTSRTQVETHDELEELSDAFNSMTAQLAERQSALQEMNENLTLERDRQKVLLQSMSDGVVAVDDEAKILLFNASAERITGYQQASVLNRNINAALQLYDNEELVPLEKYTDQTAKYRQHLKGQGLTIHTDNGPKILSLSAAPFKLEDKERNGWIITFSDITDEKEFESMKLDFVSMAAHELRTPLTALRGYLSIIQEEANEKLSQDEHKYLNRSLISANQLTALVENLLNLSRVERGALKLSLSKVAIEDLIASTVDNLQNIAKQKDIDLIFTPAKKKHYVQADSFRVSEVLTNLVANGINYTAAGGWVKIQVGVKNDMLTVSVSDNGQGIPASSLSHLFTKFYRVQSTLAMGSKGTGLGLYISKAIIEAHRGKIWVESIEGEGSTFYFSLPMNSDDSKQKPTK